MSTTDKPLDDGIAALLETERSAPALDRAHVDRALTRVTLSIGSALVHEAPSPASPPPPSPLGRYALAKVGAIAAVAFAVGVGTGMSIRSAPVATPPSLPSSTVTPVAAPPMPVPQPSAIPTATPPPIEALSVRPPRTTSSEPSRIEVVVRERALLDEASRLLRNGEPTEALALVMRYEKDFPQGSLKEEREVLRIQALVATSDLDEARSRADAFRRTYPASPFRPAVDSLLRPKDSGAR